MVVAFVGICFRDAEREEGEREEFEYFRGGHGAG